MRPRWPRKGLRLPRGSGAAPGQGQCAQGQRNRYFVERVVLNWRCLLNGVCLTTDPSGLCDWHTQPSLPGRRRVREASSGPCRKGTGEQTPNGATGPCERAVRGPAFGPGLHGQSPTLLDRYLARKPPAMRPAAESRGSSWCAVSARISFSGREIVGGSDLRRGSAVGQDDLVVRLQREVPDAAVDFWPFT